MDDVLIFIIIMLVFVVFAFVLVSMILLIKIMLKLNNVLKTQNEKSGDSIKLSEILKLLRSQKVTKEPQVVEIEKNPKFIKSKKNKVVKEEKVQSFEPKVNEIKTTDKAKKISNKMVYFDKPQKINEVEENEPSKIQSILLGIWNWIIVGDEYRQKDVSFEYAIAVTWLLRSAIIMIVTGAGFLLKYSIENSFLGPAGRVTLSLLFGIVMLISGIKLLKGKYHTIAQGLIGGAIAIFYFSSFASFSMYHLVSVNIAFALMIFVTITSAVLAIKLNSLLVAILGTIGGYFTPIALSTGSGNIFALFAYMLMLGIGVLVVAKYKRWKLLNALSFISNYLIFFIALEEMYDKTKHFPTAMTFAVLYFVLFSAITVIYNLINKEKVTVLELIGMFANVAIFFPTSYVLINSLYPKEYIAIVSLGLALFYISGVLVFIKRNVQDKSLLIFMIGFASFFVTITIPLIFSNALLTPAWAIQAFIFLWMSSKLRNSFLRKLAYTVYGIAFLRLMSYDLNHSFIDIETVNYFPEMTSRFITFGFIIISVVLGYRVLKSETKDVVFRNNISNIKIDEKSNSIVSFFIWTAGILAFIYLHFEFYYLCREFYNPLHIPMMSAIWIVAIVFMIKKLASTGNKIFKTASILLLAGIVIKLFVYDLVVWDLSVNYLVYGNVYSLEYSLMRLLDFVPMIAIGFYSYTLMFKNKIDGYKIFASFALGLLFIYLSLELNTFLHFYNSNFRPGGISILWSIFAISTIFFGIKKHLKVLRYTGLILFTICVFKIFLSDLNKLDSLYRIIAFMVLGVIVLIGAFLYAKFKESFVIQDNNTEDKDEK